MSISQLPISGGGCCVGGGLEEGGEGARDADAQRVDVGTVDCLERVG